MVADPFEVEHNTTGQISARNLERMNKTWKRILLRSKMKKFTGRFQRFINKIFMVPEPQTLRSIVIHLRNIHLGSAIYFKILIKTMLMH